MFAVRRIFSIANVAERACANDKDVTRVTRRRDLCTSDHTPFNEGPFRLAVRSDTFIRPTIGRDAGNTPGLFVNKDQRVLADLDLSDRFRFDSRYFRVLRVRFVIGLRSFHFLSFFSGYFG